MDQLPASLSILLVEDEPLARRQMRQALVAQGHRILEAESGAEALDIARQHAPDVVLLDLGLPDMDGLEVARRLRAAARTPILVLSSMNEERRKIAALDSGADDYLTKPCSVDELLARIRSVLRRSWAPASASDGRFVSGSLTVDLARRAVSVDGEPVHLTPIEFKLLTRLITQAGHVVPHEELLVHAWGPTAAGRHEYLRVYMTHLRRKLEPRATSPRLIRNEVGVGYRLVHEPPPAKE
ncbi:response regulator transcription factor [Myxococcota bacterium]|nr:response regulator transcription factor [Myxococcota bacterium]